MASAVRSAFRAERSQSQTVRFLAIWQWADTVEAYSSSSSGKRAETVLAEASIQLMAPLGSLIVRCLETNPKEVREVTADITAGPEAERSPGGAYPPPQPVAWCESTR